ncbi:invasion associated locus B family protein [Zavarzinia sp. CC-PAN008]|uniref:invasion associated locus B family protein n=1 Tax=Zavarzinia sp. CC-PAN008 TaxID=3243332 RepID=UPI003F743D2D
MLSAPAAVLMAGLLMAGPALAQSPRSLGTFGDWDAFSTSDSGKPVCYVATSPKTTKPTNVRRDPIFLLVTHRGNVRNEVSVVTGYTYKPKSEVKAAVDGSNFTLFTQGDGAWARDQQTDARIVDAMRKGAQMVVKGTSSRGTETTDTYSLKGISAALDAINKACPP